MRRGRGWLIWGVLLVWLLGPGAEPAGAACVGPVVRLDPARGAPGSRVTVSGWSFAAECLDQGQGGRAAASEGLVVRFVQGSRSWDLVTVDADYEYRINCAVSLPVDARPGYAEVTVEGAVSGELIVTEERAANPSAPRCTKAVLTGLVRHKNVVLGALAAGVLGGPGLAVVLSRRARRRHQARVAARSGATPSRGAPSGRLGS